SERFPQALDDRLIELLRTSAVFDGWDLERVVRDRQAFLLFLQERWAAFVQLSSGGPPVSSAEEEGLPSLEVAGPLHLPLDHDDVRVYIDNLFVEGLLTPLAAAPTSPPVAEWIAVGIRRDPKRDRMRRFDKLASTIEEELPSPDARHQQWL
ncbi:MAG: BREX-3 system phosphatase PglZ, partial [Anaerolineae bacterium]|nr:BREX-3 system phosphatase PglZ [Anaerolineae bacterium]